MVRRWFSMVRWFGYGIEPLVLIFFAVQKKMHQVCTISPSFPCFRLFIAIIKECALFPALLSFSQVCWICIFQFLLKQVQVPITDGCASNSASFISPHALDMNRLTDRTVPCSVAMPLSRGATNSIVSTHFFQHHTLTLKRVIAGVACSPGWHVIRWHVSTSIASHAPASSHANMHFI